MKSIKNLRDRNGRRALEDGKLSGRTAELR